MAYRTTPHNLVHEVIDGEVLAIRSDTGTYYSMRDSAATVWAALVAGGEIDELAAAAAVHHGGDTEALASEIATFVEELADEELVVKTEGSGDLSSYLPAETADTPWTTPSLEKFTDMQDLLLFDPIHEVEASGWPAKSTDAGT